MNKKVVLLILILLIPIVISLSDGEVSYEVQRGAITVKVQSTGLYNNLIELKNSNGEIKTASFDCGGESCQGENAKTINFDSIGIYTPGSYYFVVTGEGKDSLKVKKEFTLSLTELYSCSKNNIYVANNKCYFDFTKDANDKGKKCENGVEKNKCNECGCPNSAYICCINEKIDECIGNLGSCVLPSEKRVLEKNITELCTTEYYPVCGVNGVTYSNSCLAQVAGIGIAYTGACSTACVPSTEICNDGKDNDCEGKIDCLDTSCNSASNCQSCNTACPAAICNPRVEVCGNNLDDDCDGNTDEGCGVICTTEYDPVCGVNGVTYSNSCLVQVAGIGIAYTGACIPTEKVIGKEVVAGCNVNNYIVPNGICANNVLDLGLKSSEDKFAMECYCSEVASDLDNDGFDSVDFINGRDCDDSNPGINPLSIESCNPDVNNNNGIDENCDGKDLDCSFSCDRDGDGQWDSKRWYCLNGKDCDDGNANRFLGNEEICGDLVDNDCDSIVDNPDVCVCKSGETRIIKGVTSNGEEKCVDGKRWELTKQPINTPLFSLKTLKGLYENSPVSADINENIEARVKYYCPDGGCKVEVS